MLYEVGISCMNVDDEGKDVAAVDAFTQALALAPDLHQAHLARALADENLGDLAAAAADLDVVIPQVRRPAGLLEKRGLWRLRLGRPGDALADFEAAASLGHEPLDLLTGRGSALQALGDLPPALREFDRAVERHPTAVVVRINRAHARLAVADGSGARADLDWVAEHGASHPNSWKALVLRAALRNQDGDREGAVTDLERIAAALGIDTPTQVAECLRQLRTEAQTEETGAGAGE